MDVLDLLIHGGLHVTLFFFLSGYLLVWSEDKRVRMGTYSLRAYVLRRVLRLMPAYYVAILFVILIRPSHPSTWDVLIHFSFLHALVQPFTVTALDPAWWTLTTEVILCLMVPFLVLKLPRLSQRLVLFVALFLAMQVAVRFNVPYAEDPTSLQIGGLNVWYLSFLPYYMTLFMAGVLLRMLVQRQGKTPPQRPLLASILLLVSVPLLLTYPYFQEMIGQLPVLLGAAQTLVQGAMQGLLGDIVRITFFASIVLGSPLLFRLLYWGPLSFVGRISYSLFLLHETVMVFGSYLLKDVVGSTAEQSNIAAWAVFSTYTLGVLVVALAISYLSYRYVESPFLQRKPK